MSCRLKHPKIESVCYVAEQSMWFIFVGTGLLFGSKLATSGWGYIDTMGLLGLIAKNGCVTYLPGENQEVAQPAAHSGEHALDRVPEFLH